MLKFYAHFLALWRLVSKGLRALQGFSHIAKGKQSPRLSRESREQIPPQSWDMSNLNYVTIKHLQDLLCKSSQEGLVAPKAQQDQPVVHLSSLLSTRWQQYHKEYSCSETSNWRCPATHNRWACFYIHVNLRKRTGLKEWQASQRSCVCPAKWPPRGRQPKLCASSHEDPKVLCLVTLPPWGGETGILSRIIHRV